MAVLATAIGHLHTRSVLDWNCWRCGQLFENSKPNPNLLCADCRLVEHGAKYRNTYRLLASGVEGLEGSCRAWLRDFDDLDHPIHPDGTLVAPGERLCRHSDCVEPTHIVSPDE